MSITELPIGQYNSIDKKTIAKKIELAIETIDSDYISLFPLRVKSFIKYGKHCFSVSNSHGRLFDLNCKPDYVFSQQRINAIAQYIETHVIQ